MIPPTQKKSLLISIRFIYLQEPNTCRRNSSLKHIVPMIAVPPHQKPFPLPPLRHQSNDRVHKRPICGVRGSNATSTSCYIANSLCIWTIISTIPLLTLLWSELGDEEKEKQ